MAASKDQRTLSEPAPDRTSLADIPVGASGVVREIHCPRRVARRLMEMGILPGTGVRLVRVAPLGDPIELAVRGYSLSIRRHEAASIFVEDVCVTATAPAAVGPRAVP